jgi:hypothetical protein
MKIEWASWKLNIEGILRYFIGRVHDGKSVEWGINSLAQLFPDFEKMINEDDEVRKWLQEFFTDVKRKSLSYDAEKYLLKIRQRFPDLDKAIRDQMMKWPTNKRVRNAK